MRSGAVGAVSQVVTEVGSGMSGYRRGLMTVLSDLAATVLVVEHRGLVVEHRDRLTRFGFGHLAACGGRVVVRDAAQTTDDLVCDVTEVLTSRCARRYGRRSASRRAAEAVAVATGGTPV